MSNLGYNVFSFFNQRFLVELFYNRYITGIVLKLGGQTTKVMDKGSVELFGPFGLQKKFNEISKSINTLSNGIVTFYALYILIGLIFYIAVFYLSVELDNCLELVIVLFALISINTKPNLENKESEKNLEKKYYSIIF